MSAGEERRADISVELYWQNKNKQTFFLDSNKLWSESYHINKGRNEEK